ncbi:MAG: hypothetical protein GWP91_17875 [Rhodobacterales bacterium]|nr:hypothetical protein [Rhodobacterales bacterium]
MSQRTSLPKPDLPMPSRQSMRRYAVAAERYRIAFEAVKTQLKTLDLGRVPSWVFALDRMELSVIAKLSHPLALAERERRRWRTALHALAELIALSGNHEPENSDKSKSEDAITSLLEDDNDSELDQFITVVNHAKSGGAIYLNGTFEPVTSSRKSPGPTPVPSHS